MTNTTGPAILIVEDDPQVRDLYEQILEDDYYVQTVESGEAALMSMNSNIDACLVDRRMPGLTGGDVVRQFRERGFDQPVAMVTAVEPDFDVLELGFDDYIVKPVSRSDLRNLVRSLVLRRKFDDILREYFALASKVASLRASKPSDELAANDAYGHLVDNLNEIKQEAKHSLDAAIDAGLLEEMLWESFLDGREAGLAELE